MIRIISIWDTEAVWLVDCGDFDKVEEVTSGKTITGVLLTHAHFDHIYGLPVLLEKHPACKVYTNESGCAALGDARLNLSRYHGTPVLVSPDRVCLCDEGDDVPLFNGVTAHIYATPGHHPSCLCFQEGFYLFTGDSFIPSVKVVTNLPGGNKKQALDSMGMILDLAKGLIICPGHKAE